MTRALLRIAIALSLLASSCYLPRADIQRDVDTLVLASVSRCSSESVSGMLRNDADVAVQIELTAMWLDITSEVYHEASLSVPRIEAASEVPWKIDTGAEVASPLQCTVEMSSVEAIE